jgi:hypothetical protein
MRKEQQRPPFSCIGQIDWAAAGIRRHGEIPNRSHWKDLILFFEYFHGDNGTGLGASHQTGLVAKLIDLFGRLDAHQYLDVGKSGLFAKDEKWAANLIAAD